MSRPAYAEALIAPSDRRPRGFIEVDPRGRTSLARVREQTFERYAVEEFPDGTLILTPVLMVTVAEWMAAQARPRGSAGMPPPFNGEAADLDVP